VRDPRSAVASHYWRLKEWHYFHFLRRDWHYPRLAPFFLVLAAASWTVGNLLGEVAMRHAASGRVFVLRYEDLRDRPVEAVRGIAQAFGLELADVVEHLERGRGAQHRPCHRRQRRAPRARAPLRSRQGANPSQTASLGRDGDRGPVLAADAALRLPPQVGR
jgi:hypothetical protein